MLQQWIFYLKDIQMKSNVHSLFFITIIALPPWEIHFIYIFFVLIISLKFSFEFWNFFHSYICIYIQFAVVQWRKYCHAEFSFFDFFLFLVLWVGIGLNFINRRTVAGNKKLLLGWRSKWKTEKKKTCLHFLMKIIRLYAELIFKLFSQKYY